MNWKIDMISHEATYAIRHKVLWPSGGLAQVVLEGDESALHLGVSTEGRIIAVVSMFSDGPAMQFRKLAVLEEFRGKGIGTLLIRQCMTVAAQNKAHVLWCDARQSAKGFYQKLGFSIDADAFMKNGETYQKASMKLIASDIE